jgi:uncharacterized protein
MIIDELDYYQGTDLPIYQRELRDWLPPRIFDVHAHAWLPEHALRPIAEERVGLVFEAESVSWEELGEAYELLFPGKTLEWLALPMPLTVIDREANNRYIAARIDNQHSFGLLTPGLEDSAELLWQQIQAGRFVGFKPYLSYVTWKGLDEIRISDFVRPAQLEVADAHGLLIMLHVPRSGRIADPDNLADLEMIASRYPRARVILAHAGRAYSRDLIERALDVVARLPNMSFDLSNVQDSEVVEAMLERLPLERVMYGSDIPVATVRGYLFMLNGQRVCLTRKRFPWSISSEQPGQLRCTFMGYEGLRAIKRACERRSLGPEIVEALFYGNARALVDAARAAVSA